MTIISPSALPYGTTIVTEFSEENTYIVPRSQTFCFPFRVTGSFNQVLISAAHDRFQGNIDSMFNVYKSSIQNSLRAWPSEEPIGLSITALPYSLNSGVNLGGTAAVFCFYDINLPTDEIAEAGITRWINRDQTYYMNVINRENKDNNLFLEITYQ